MTDVLADAQADAQSVTELLRQLVRTPSRGGIDDYRPVVDVVASWQRAAGLGPRILERDGRPVAVVTEVHGGRPGPHLVLDACLDTAALGDETSWTREPFGAETVDGWMYGRGAADSKAAVSVFSHILARLAHTPQAFAGTVTALFDLDEHTGGFAGIKTFLDTNVVVDAAAIGYPGEDSIVVGGRGFLRARISVFGEAGHTGSSRTHGVNAVSKALALADGLTSGLHGDVDAELGLPPKVTVTSIRAGEPGVFSVVPDRADLEVDVRLTTVFDADAAWKHLHAVVTQVDVDHPAPRSAELEQVGETWPAFRLPAGHRMVRALQLGADQAGLSPGLKVAGPSNIGCLLNAHGVPTTAGFGVRYRGLHGADEAIDLSTIPIVQAAYHRAVIELQV